MAEHPVTKAKENSSCEVEFLCKDENKVIIPGSTLSTATWTLKDRKSGDTINSRTAVNFISNVDENGLATIALTALDNPIINAAPGKRMQEEIHIMTVNFTAPGGVALTEEIFIRVENKEQT